MDWPQPGHLRERVLGAGGAADHVGGLQHDDVQAGAGQQDRGDQAVVAGADDHDVGAGGKRGHGVGL